MPAIVGFAFLFKRCASEDVQLFQAMLPLQGALDFVIFMLKEEQIEEIGRLLSKICCFKCCSRHELASSGDVDALLRHVHREYEYGSIHGS